MLWRVRNADVFGAIRHLLRHLLRIKGMLQVLGEMKSAVQKKGFVYDFEGMKTADW